MAGAVRQPIDLASLERYIESNVPEIKVPIDIKQVQISPNSGIRTGFPFRRVKNNSNSLDMASQIPHTS
jgi:hypothetical protein